MKQRIYAGQSLIFKSLPPSSLVSLSLANKVVHIVKVVSLKIN